MTPALKTTSILALAAALSVAALALSQAGPPQAVAHNNTSRSASSGVISLHSQLASEHVLQGSHDSYLAVTLRAPAHVGQFRPDVDIAVVIDRSGSMDGEKLAQAKLAARQLITNLHQNDRFTLIAYGTDVDVLVPSTQANDSAKAAAMDTISSIYTDGGTNLSGGLEAAKAQLVRLSRDPSRVQRIVLISDGQANEGIIAPKQLARLAASASSQGVSITTVGIGLDFDEKSMTSIAVAGGGNYYFAESASMLAEMFDTELRKLGATVATQIRLQLKIADHVQLQEIIGHSMVREGDTWIVSVPDMHAGETRKVVLSLRVDASGTGAMPIAMITASFVDTVAGERGSAQNELFAAITSDVNVVNQTRNSETNRLIERALTAQAIDKATILYEQGHSADARKLVRERTLSAQKQAMELDDAEFAAEMGDAQQAINMNFAQAPAKSTGGKRARKKNRNAAYIMMK
ncbi:MAG: VWA domain-containing protein [Kofleriaceae bacterium]|nr:VWA domain-containing protein [Kofleriaceae bacterium]